MKTFRQITVMVAGLLLLSACGKMPFSGTQQRVLPQDANQNAESAPADPKKLTREDALRLINATPKEPLYTYQIRFERVEWQFPNQGAPAVDSIPEQVSAPRRQELANKLLTIVPIGRKVSGSLGDQILSWSYQYDFRPTNLGQGCINRQGAVILGLRQPIAVTGMTVPSSAMGRTESIADFTYKITLTPYGKIADSNGSFQRPAANPDKIFEGQAELVLYDDGWRVDRVIFPASGQEY